MEHGKINKKINKTKLVQMVSFVSTKPTFVLRKIDFNLRKMALSYILFKVSTFYAFQSKHFLQKA